MRTRSPEVEFDGLVTRSRKVFFGTPDSDCKAYQTKIEPNYDDGKDHYLIDIVAGEEFPVYIYYYIPSGGTLTIEWGDGQIDTVTGEGSSVETAHTYGDIGSYEIKVSCDTDGWYPYGNSTSGVLGQVYTDSGETGRYLSPSRLSEIHLADRTMELNDYSFATFCRLIKFTIPSGVTSIGNYTFGDCFSLTSITIPSGVTSIGDYTFSGSLLTSVVIPDGVTSIGDYTFFNCPKLEYVELKPTTPPTLSSSTAFDITNNCPIYVPDESVDTYKAASQWSSLASRIYGISEKGE